MEELTREQIHERRAIDFQHCFSGPHGERVLEWLSKFCLEHTSTFVGDSGRMSDFNEGARAVILEIRHWLDYDLKKLNKE